MKNITNLLLILVFFSCSHKKTITIVESDSSIRKIKIEPAIEEVKIESDSEFTKFEIDSQNIILTVFERDENSDNYYQEKEKPLKIDTIGFKNDILYLGKFVHNRKVIANIPIINSGEIPLVIYRCTSSGGAMIADVEESVIYPGEKGYVDIQIHTRNYIGKSTKTATISASTKEDKHRFTIQWEYIPPYSQIEFDYTEIDIGKIKSDSMAIIEFPFTNTGEYPLYIYSVKGTGRLRPMFLRRDTIAVKEKGIIQARLFPVDCNCPTIKSITCTTNTIPEKTVLTVKAEFISKKR